MAVIPDTLIPPKKLKLLNLLQEDINNNIFAMIFLVLPSRYTQEPGQNFKYSHKSIGLE